MQELGRTSVILHLVRFISKANVKHFWYLFLPHSPYGQSGYCFHPWCPDGRAVGRRENVCPGCISETVMCRKLILGRDIG